MNELMIDDADLLKVVDDKRLWFTRMAVLDLIYCEVFFAANSLGQQSTTSQYVQPLTPQTVVLPSGNIYCALSKSGCGNGATEMFSQDDSQGTFCIYAGLHFTPEATALINPTFGGCLIPPCGATPLG